MPCYGDADCGELEALYDVFFEDDWFREQFTMGAGSDLLFVSHIDLKPGWEGWNIELALVQRLCDTIGEGCELAVMPYESESEIARGQRLGFILTTPERHEGRVPAGGAESDGEIGSSPAPGSPTASASSSTCSPRAPKSPPSRAGD